MNDDENAVKWMKTVMGTAYPQKDKYGAWTWDIETTWDTEESEDHFDDQDDLFEI